MRYIRKLRRHSFLLALSVSTLLLSMIAHTERNSLYMNYSVDLLKMPQFAIVMEGIKDGMYPWSVSAKEKVNQEDIVPDKATEDINPMKKETTLIQVNGEDNSVYPSGSSTKNVENVDADKDTVDNTVTNIQDKINTQDTTDIQDTVREFETVEESYFDDALFIGDSRTVGLSEYSGWSEPTYHADVGMTIYSVFDKKVIDKNKQKISLSQLLETKKFGKIYIMLGINEMGDGTTQSFTEAYEQVVQKIQQLQPDALIYIEGIMNVTKKKSDSDPIFNNINIKDRNESLSTLADQKTVFYIDVNEVITDETGGIPQDETFDSIHLKAAYYSIWTDFLLNHGVVK